MIQLLFTLLASEVAVVFLLLFKTPFRKLAVLGLDRVKRGRGPVMAKTVAGTIFIVLGSSVYSMSKIRERSSEIGSLTPTDQVLMSRHLLEASLMGYSLFLALIIDRLHHYIRELRGLRKNVEAVTKQNRALEEAKNGSSEESKAKEKQLSELHEKVKQLELDSESRLNEAKAAEANAFALKRQSEDFLLEYDRMLEENQNLRSQLESIDRLLSHTDSKKSS
ncbi:B-cell receptor-associated protein 31-like [Dioscorea cayenensis subsp. rotundata]|uniref:Endoplasmic reticulum transmembrane protein n=1 Tax=Dioscorea cayennensis subsp. rotundata TaxID=55577 RepID=A0AB40D1R3_DIOCR|nr:B-cell receptor-associated protein 31-like [Dioscorea cayenensis subsp. rotundata]